MNGIEGYEARIAEDYISESCTGRLIKPGELYYEPDIMHNKHTECDEGKENEMEPKPESEPKPARGKKGA